MKKPTTLLSSFKSFTFRLWDEKGSKLVDYRNPKNRTKVTKLKANNFDYEMETLLSFLWAED
jgi:hypothetical protein